MAVNTSRIFTGGPDQLTTGAILSAPMSVTAPTDTQILANTLPAGFEDSGYVSSDGLALSLSKSFETIKEWGGQVVKRILSEFDGTIKYTHLELSEFSLKDTFGDAQVVKTAATTGHGEQFKVAIGAVDLPNKRYLFRMKDGAAKIRLFLPAAVVTELDEIVFVKNDAIKLSVTLGCQPDDQGNIAYLYTDDGVTAVPGA